MPGRCQNMEQARSQRQVNSRTGFAIEGSRATCVGNWQAQELHDVEKLMSQVKWPADAVEFDLGGITSLDTVGAWLLFRTIREIDDGNRQLSVLNVNEQHQKLLDLVEDRSESIRKPPKPYVPGVLESIGRHTSSQFLQYFEFLNFIGKLAIVFSKLFLRPWRLRWGLVVKELQSADVNALPIVGLLAFLIGIVIAYQGGIVLRDYGANIYVADIVGLSMVRELAPLITAIIVAGRTGSAYTAQIGTMMVTEEVDALRSIGVAPLEILVLPYLVALVIALPLLTVFADAMGLFGGMIMASSMLDLNSSTFINRLTEAMTMNSYLSGIGKAPVFAAIIAVVGCFQGFRVYGSAESVGRQTTISVVESIFLVIIVDAAFSVAFSKLGI